MARSTFFHDLSQLPSFWARLLLRGVVRIVRPMVEILHPERLAPLPRPAIFAFNHNNAFEALAIPALLIYLRQGRVIHFFIDWMYLRIPVLGWVLRQCQPIPVFTKKARWDLGRGYRRRQARRKPVSEALLRLRRGECVGIFPEGTRNRHATKLRRGRLGIAELVLGAEAPVVPIGIEFPAGRRLGHIPSFGKIRLVIGEPLDFRAEREVSRLAEAGPETTTPRRPSGASMALRKQIVHRIMEAISQVSSKAYPYHRPIAADAPSGLPRVPLPTQHLEVS